MSNGIRRSGPSWKRCSESTACKATRSSSIPKRGELFAYAEIDDQERWEAIAETAVCKRWWAHMKDLMPSNPDNSPASRELKEVFHINCVPKVTPNSSDK